MRYPCCTQRLLFFIYLIIFSLLGNAFYRMQHKIVFYGSNYLLKIRYLRNLLHHIIFKQYSSFGFVIGLSHQMGGYLSSNAGMTDHPAPNQSNSSTVILFCKNLLFLPYGISFCLPLYSCSSNGSPSWSWKKVIFFPV